LGLNALLLLLLFCSIASLKMFVSSFPLIFFFKIDIEKLAAALPLNLIAVLLSPNDGDRDLAYVLRGVRLLNTLSDVATRYAKLEQVLFIYFNMKSWIFEHLV
jgi:hypothetical protein